jgi:hypothetical protein
MKVFNLREILSVLRGNWLLEHFDVVIDYGDSAALYIKPNRNYDKSFKLPKHGFTYKNRNETLNA